MTPTNYKRLLDVVLVLERVPSDIPIASACLKAAQFLRDGVQDTSDELVIARGRLREAQQEVSRLESAVLQISRELYAAKNGRDLLADQALQRENDRLRERNNELLRAVAGLRGRLKRREAVGA